MKKLIILTVLFVIAAGAAFLFGKESKAEISGVWKYTVNGTKATITGYTGSDSNLVIPETIDGYKVTEIGYQAFKNNAELTKVTMPSTLVKIYFDTFQNCSNLHEVLLNEGLEEISLDAFNECDIIKLTLPKSLTYLGGDAFANNRNMTEITIYSEMLSASDTFVRAGRNTENGIKVVFKSTVKSINPIFRVDNDGEYPAVKEVKIESGVKSMAYASFDDCLELEKVVVYEDNLEIPNYNNMFGDSKTVTIFCHYGSTAYNYAKQYGYNVALLWKTGDLNADHKIDTSDAVIILKAAAGMITLSSDQKTIGDVNRDGAITTLDAVYILRYAAGIIQNF